MDFYIPKHGGYTTQQAKDLGLDPGNVIAASASIVKFPLPPEGLIEYFDLSPMLASFVAISELSAGILLIIGGFIRNPYGDILTRLASLTIVIMMINIFLPVYMI